MWWKQYRKNFIGMQTVVALITVAAYFALYHRAWAPTMSFFFVLQGATFAGALWASRIRRRFDPNAR